MAPAAEAPAEGHLYMVGRLGTDDMLGFAWCAARDAPCQVVTRAGSQDLPWATAMSRDQHQAAWIVLRRATCELQVMLDAQLVPGLPCDSTATLAYTPGGRLSVAWTDDDGSYRLEIRGSGGELLAAWHADSIEVSPSARYAAVVRGPLLVLVDLDGELDRPVTGTIAGVERAWVSNGLDIDGKVVPAPGELGLITLSASGRLDQAHLLEDDGRPVASLVCDLVACYQLAKVLPGQTIRHFVSRERDGLEVLTMVLGPRRCRATLWRQGELVDFGCVGYGELTWLEDGSIMEQSGFEVLVNGPLDSLRFSLDPGQLSLSPVPPGVHPSW